MCHVVGALSLAAGSAFAIALPGRSTCVWTVWIVMFVQRLRLSNVCRIDWVRVFGITTRSSQKMVSLVVKQFVICVKVAWLYLISVDIVVIFSIL